MKSIIGRVIDWALEPVDVRETWGVTFAMLAWTPFLSCVLVWIFR